MENVILKRNIFQRLFGICATQKPSDDGCWTYENGSVVVVLARAPELAHTDGALRLEGKNLPGRVLVVKGTGGTWHAFKNRCTHAGRRLDPVPGTGRVQCCSVGKSTFDSGGTRLSGSAKKGIVTFPVTEKEGRLEIVL